MTGLVAGPVQTVEVPVPMTQEEVVHVPKVITQNRVRCQGRSLAWLSGCVEDGANTMCILYTPKHAVFVTGK